MVNRAERRGGFTNTSLTVPWAPGLPISLCFFHCNHTGKNETGSPKNKGGRWQWLQAQGGSKLVRWELCIGWVRGPLLEASKASIGLPLPHPQERKTRQSPGRSPAPGTEREFLSV